jgi:hypothetical protein
MSDVIVSRLGQVEATGDEFALFLTQFAGEVLTAFKTETKTQGRFLERTIKNGRTAQFPATWKIAGGYHTPGTPLATQVVKHDQVTLSTDGLLVAPAFIDIIDEAMNHYDVRSIYTTECGNFLAGEKDKNLLRCALKAATTGNGGDSIFSSASPAGTSVTHASMKTDAVVLASGIFTARQTFAENDVPSSHKMSAFLRPAQYFLLAANKDLLNRDWGGVGSFAKAELPEVAGVELVMTNNLPITNETGSASVLDKYEGNWSAVAAAVCSPYAAATLKLLDLQTESWYDPRYQGHYVLAKYAMGHGVIRPECAVKLGTS